MKIFQNILKKTKASKLWFSMVVVFMVIFNTSFVEARSLMKGEEYKETKGEFIIRVVSSVEVEIEKVNKGDGFGGHISLGQYTIDGDRVRIVFGGIAGAMVAYYKITPDGLIEEKGGRVFYSKDGLATKEKMVKSEKNRNAAAVIAARFTFIGSEVTDKKTGLIWRRCAVGMVYRGSICTGTASEFNHKEALQHAAAQARSTGKSWRVPEKDELASIIDISHYSPAIDPIAFAASPSHMFWSAASPNNQGWVAIFGDGSVVNGVLNTDWGGFVRLVRSGQ